MKYVVRPISDRTTFTGKHRPAAFKSTWTATLQLLGREVRELCGRDVVLEVDVEERHIRLDGGLRADARPASPAVRVAFESMHGPLTYGTDVFTSWQDNVRAIALGLESLRRVDRYGITRRGEQYTGFKALPAGGSAPASHMTADVARDALLAFVGDGRGSADNSDSELVRRARAVTHPDRRGGDRAGWDVVEEAAKVLGVAR